MKKWNVIALIPYPLEQTAPSDPETGGLPKNLRWESRILESTKNYGGVLVGIKQRDHFDYWNTFSFPSISEPAEIHLIVGAAESDEALRLVDQLLEDICDDLSFRLQSPIPILSLEVLDVTPPVEIGDERATLLYPLPNGYKHPKFGTMVYLNSSDTELKPELKVDFSSYTLRDRAILRWYHKAQISQAEVDRFLHLMVCLEILCEEYSEHVAAPYKASCGHEILNCPECGASTTKKINGATLKKYLTEQLGMSNRHASDTWRLRQMIHGANDLSTSKIEKISEICRALKCSVSNGIKIRFSIDPSIPPYFNAGGAGMSQQVAYIGSRAIRKDDLHFYINR